MGGNRNIPVLIVNTGLPEVSEGWYIGGGVFVQSPLLCRLLFVLFLPKQEKGNKAVKMLQQLQFPLAVFRIILKFA